MKKGTVVITCFSLVIVLFGISIFWANQSNWAVRTKALTQQQAMKEMPYITITDKEFLLIQNINQNEEIQKAVKNGQITDQIIEKGNELVSGILSGDIQSSEFPLFSVGSNVIYIEYVINGHRVIIALPENDTIIKAVTRYSKKGIVKAVYENTDNKEYKKASLVPQFWFNIFGN